MIRSVATGGVLFLLQVVPDPNTFAAKIATAAASSLFVAAVLWMARTTHTTSQDARSLREFIWGVNGAGGFLKDFHEFRDETRAALDNLNRRGTWQ